MKYIAPFFSRPTVGGILAIAASLFPSPARSYQPPAPSRDVAAFRVEWSDSKRDRTIPAKIYHPKEGKGPWPVIIFSHGLGGSKEGYEYLGRHWAGCGYISVHLQHAGSDEGVWRDVPARERMDALRSATSNVGVIANRPLDVIFALDELERLNKDAGFPLAGKLDLANIGMAGHSFGAFTTLAIAGQRFAGPTRWKDARVKAAISMSAPAARPAMRDRAYTEIEIPVFHMTGTKDSSPIGDTEPEERRIPFDKMTSKGTCLLTFKDGDHMVFSGMGEITARGTDRSKDPEFQALIQSSSTAFWDGWLKGDATALKWLNEGAFAELLGSRGVFETKKRP